jgi:nitronate monooxygenase
MMSLQDLLKVRYPIIQAPMAGSDSPQFVAAACNAGVLGSLGGQYRTPEELKKAITEIRSLTDRPFAVNLFALPDQKAPTEEEIEKALSALEKHYKQLGVARPSAHSVKNTIDPDEQLQVILDEKVPVFSFTLGLPKERWMNKLKEKSIVLIGAATNVKEARALEAAGVDAITAQGSEAGGHRGTFIGPYEKSMIGNMALIPQVVDAVKIPVVAAGGIMDGRGIAAAFALGAKGVQLGTAFLTVTESPVHANYKKAIRNHDADDTVITKVFSGGAARGIHNEFVAEHQDKRQLPFPYHNSLTRPLRKVANETGQIQYTNLWTGQGGRLAREITIDELVKHLIAETEDVLKKMNAFKLRSSQFV